jgi:cytochrome P450
MLWNFLSRLVEERRGGPSERDLVTALANAEIEGERLPEDVIVSFFRQLMNAGGDTSYHGFSNILAALFNHPEQLEAIRRDRSLIPQAIEEGLRWVGPIGSILRGCAEDTVVAGTTIPAGAHVSVCLAAANRDHVRWQDAQRFDIFRATQRHLAFGYGPHVCIGQHLARLELQMALNTLLDRLPNLRLDADHEAPRILGFTLRGADAVHVTWN